MTKTNIKKIEQLLIPIGYKKIYNEHLKITYYFLENKEGFININFLNDYNNIDFIINPLATSEKLFSKITFNNYLQLLKHIKIYHKNYFRNIKLQKLQNYEK